MADPKAENAYRQAVELSDEFSSNFIELAALLRQLYETDPERFRDLAKAKKIGSRKAYYMVELDRVFADSGVAKAVLTEIGWTKLALITKEIQENPKRLKELIKAAREHTAADLRRILKGEQPLGNYHVLLMNFSTDDFTKISEVLVQFGAERAGRTLNNKEAALMNLVNHYLHQTR